MHYGLAVIGAHDGTRTLPLIEDASRKGRVLLVEPVPYLYERLQKTVAHIPQVRLANICVSLVDGMVEFTAPLESARSVFEWGDQLGSLNPAHATYHEPRLAGHVEKILAESMTFAALVRSYEISSLDFLITDLEGFDCELLPTFPFHSVMPGSIAFEFKHADGPMRVGRRLGELLITLDGLGYDITVLDPENMLARRRPSSR